MTDFNPNWTAFAAALGTTPADLNPGTGTNAMFMGWITRQAADFTAATGVTRETHAGEYAWLFSEWLVATHVPVANRTDAYTPAATMSACPAEAVA